MVARARQLARWPNGCAVSSWSGQRRVAPYVTGTVPTDGATVPDGVHVAYLLVNMDVPERVAMTVTGHKTRSVLGRYHIVSRRICKTSLGSVTSPLGACRGSPLARTTLQ